MIIVTTDGIAGKNVQAIGYVKGAIVQSKHVGNDIMASFKTIVGGEIKGYTEMLNEARETAIQRMSAEAAALGADAVVGIRFASASVMQGAAEIIVYGTAVKII